MKLLLLIFMTIVSLFISGRLAFLLTPILPGDSSIFSSGIMTIFFILVWIGLCLVVFKILDFCLFSGWHIENKNK